MFLVSSELRTATSRAIALATADPPNASPLPLPLQRRSAPLCALRFPSFPMSKNRFDYTRSDGKCPDNLSRTDMKQGERCQQTCHSERSEESLFRARVSTTVRSLASLGG